MSYEEILARLILQGLQNLQPEDLAQAALLMATLHPRATIPELIMTPSIYQYS